MAYTFNIQTTQISGAYRHLIQATTSTNSGELETYLVCATTTFEESAPVYFTNLVSQLNDDTSEIPIITSNIDMDTLFYPYQNIVIKLSRDITEADADNSDNSDSTTDSTYTVVFMSLDNAYETEEEIEEGTILSAPESPTRDGYTFIGWYTDYACTQLYNFESKVTTSFNLYAGWSKA